MYEYEYIGTYDYICTVEGAAKVTTNTVRDDEAVAGHSGGRIVPIIRF
jgi:hypothetical protein